MARQRESGRRWICVGDSPAVRLAGLDFGVREATTLVFLHGGAGRANQWRHQMEYFSQRYRVVAYDFRGHGESEVVHSDYSFDEMVQDLEWAVDELEVPERFHLITHSFGGAVGAAYAVRHAQRLERLALVATAGEIPLSPFLPALLQLPGPVLDGVRKVFRNQINCPPAVLKRLVPTLMRWRGWDLYERIQTPTLVLSGELDLLTRPRMMRRMADLIPNCEFVSLPFCGHLPQLERPAAVNRILERFLEPNLKRTWRGTIEAPEGAA
ncbi:MAG: alpha/beta fold hydrolase [Candidatus Eremiobacterota bacterium]